MKFQTILLWGAGIIIALNLYNYMQGTHILQQKNQDDKDREKREEEAAKNAKAMPEKP